MQVARIVLAACLPAAAGCPYHVDLSGDILGGGRSLHVTHDSIDGFPADSEVRALPPNPSFYMFADHPPELPMLVAADGSPVPCVAVPLELPWFPYRLDCTIERGAIMRLPDLALGNVTYLIDARTQLATHRVTTEETHDRSHHLYIESDAVVFRIETTNRVTYLPASMHDRVWFDDGPARVVAMYADRREELIFEQLEPDQEAEAGVITSDR